MVPNEDNTNAFNNDGYTRDLDERKDSEVKSGRDPGKALSFPIPSPGVKRRKPFYKTCSFWTNALILILLIAFLLLHELNFLPHYHGGFYCGDPKLSFVYQGDTVTISCLLLTAVIIPFVIMAVTELSRYRPEKYVLSNVRLRTACKNTLIWYREYILSIFFVLVFFEVIKGIIGEPRPHFLDTCKPDAAINCTVGTYISKYTCTNTQYSKWFILDSIKSFPSGHTALSLIMGIHTFCYTQKRLCDQNPRLLGPIIQMLTIVWSIVCSFTRVVDNRHHWWDVLAGAVLGLIIGYYGVRTLCKDFKCQNTHLSRTNNGDVGSSDNHNNLKRLSYNTSPVRQENFDGLRQIT